MSEVVPLDRQRAVMRRLLDLVEPAIRSLGNDGLVDDADEFLRAARAIEATLAFLARPDVQAAIRRGP